ncbi:universal stress protein [Halalkalicoccus sp. NIPERK01]|uniref:universal stress protein n=1 Tax=Halalkalicoccus sp. NIPERK01 TaxID=3053469 RepID=UPI00256F326E|nr:universal stress protein [Halalkalicoccus sp. NIPERK01]MDL5360654.1 universal stress protein [Halalkalicoccus sp. NIPERK01]
MYDRILIPTDGSEEARKAVDHGIDLAAAVNASVHALFVVESRLSALPSDSMRQVTEREEWVRYGEEVTEEVVADAEARGVSGVAAVEHGKAHKEIVEYAEENGIDCIVMGTHGRDGVQDVILGNVTERVVRTANVPVLTVRRGKLE